jgi:glutathione S-transferase
MLTIYGCYRSRASRIYWLAEELGLPAKSVPVVQARKVADPLAATAPINTASPAFLAINPMGQIPTIDDDGVILSESSAICLYLARKHGGPLGPKSAAEDGEMLQWTFWGVAAVELHSVVVTMADDRGEAETEAGRARIAAARAALDRPFAVLEKRLAGTDYIVGGRFTVVDLLVAEIVRYVQGHPEFFESYPKIVAWLARCQDRPAFKAWWEKRLAETL